MAHKLLRRLRLVRLSPFDELTEAGRSDERHRRAALTTLASFGNQLFGILVALLSVPLTIGYLGTERYGLWLSASALVAMLAFSDLGIGTSVVTLMARAYGRSDVKLQVQLVSSATSVLLLVSAALVSALLLLTPSLDWSQILNLQSPVARKEAPDVVVTLGLVFSLTLPLSLVQRVQSGLQSGYAGVLFAAGGTLLSLVALVLATQLEASVVWLVLALSLPPAVARLANWIWFFGFRRRDLRPRLSQTDSKVVWELLHTGIWFLTLQLSVSFAFTSDNLVVAAALGSAAVPLLGVPAKLSNLVIQLVSLVATSLWPAFSEATARGDAAWVSRTLRRAVWLSVSVGLLGGLGIALAGGWFVALWTHGEVIVGWPILLPLALLAVCMCWGSAVASFLNGVGRVRAQAATALSTAAVAFGLKWVLVEPLGPGGVVWATIAAYVLLTMLPLGFVVRGSRRELDARGSGAAG